MATATTGQKVTVDGREFTVTESGESVIACKGKRGASLYLVQNVNDKLWWPVTGRYAPNVSFTVNDDGKLSETKFVHV